MAAGMGSGTGAGSPCGACKFLRRKCTSDCIFAPYFRSEQGPARFAAIHKIFGASNVSKLLVHVPQADRCEAIVTIAYEAQARIRDPVYGCAAHIFALQQQVAALQAQLMEVKAQLAHNLVEYRTPENYPWMPNVGTLHRECNSYPYYTTPEGAQRAAIDSVDDSSIGGLITHDLSAYRETGEMHYLQASTKKRHAHNEVGDLHALANRMMKN